MTAPRHRLKPLAACALLVGASAPALLRAQPESSAEPDIVVVGRWDNPLGHSRSASQGVVGAAELDARPTLRPGEVLEVVPGLIVTQHSGTGKANQMFLRGFNLDHGTDFATWVDGMPVNMPSHGHGQGYTDLNFLIPELVERLEYRKGAYYAEISDFSSAGGAYLSTNAEVSEGFVKAGVGEDGYFNAVAADSIAAGDKDFLYGVSVHRYAGPWVDIDEDLHRNNVLLRYSGDNEERSWNVAFMGYDAEWNSADQVPRRVVVDGLISRFGSIDTTLGGETSRYSLSGAWNAELGPGYVRTNAYLIDYDLDLFSNFTYLLDDPIDGDQFEQVDRRMISGGGFAYSLGARARTLHTVGAMLRRDDIDEVGLHHATQRVRTDTIRSDRVDELAIGLYYTAETQWSDRLRTTLGLRADRFDFDVVSNLAENSGTADDTIVAPKASFIYTVSDATELYFNVGKGFHSNDARGTTITIDPATGQPAEKVSPVVASRAMEVGFRTFVDRKLNVSASLWLLELDSELLFIGDAGYTEAGRPSRRYGVEVPIYYRANERVTFDVELALTESKFTDFDPVGDRIPGSIDEVLAAGVTFDGRKGWHGSVRFRYFGPRPLVEDGSVESSSSTVVNAGVGYRSSRYDFRVDVLNLFDSTDDDITYWYASRLPGEPVDGVEDLHFHPLEPRMLRAYVGWKF